MTCENYGFTEIRKHKSVQLSSIINIIFIIITKSRTKNNELGTVEEWEKNEMRKQENGQTGRKKENLCSLKLLT